MLSESLARPLTLLRRMDLLLGETSVALEMTIRWKRGRLILIVWSNESWQLRVEYRRGEGTLPIAIWLFPG